MGKNLENRSKNRSYTNIFFLLLFLLSNLSNISYLLALDRTSEKSPTTRTYLASIVGMFSRLFTTHMTNSRITFSVRFRLCCCLNFSLIYSFSNYFRHCGFDQLVMNFGLDLRLRLHDGRTGPGGLYNHCWAIVGIVMYLPLLLIPKKF